MTNQSHTELAAHMALVLAYANQMASRPRNEVLLNAQWKTIEASARKLAALESPERVQGEALPKIANEVRIMLGSATELSDGIGDIVGYQIKTGALHRILGLLSGAGHTVAIAAKHQAIALPTPPKAPAQDARGVNAILDALRVGKVACEWAEKTAEVQQIAAAMEIAKGMLSATPSPQAERVPLTLDEIEEAFQEAAGADEDTHIRFARAIEARIVTKEST